MRNLSGRAHRLVRVWLGECRAIAHAHAIDTEVAHLRSYVNRTRRGYPAECGRATGRGSCWNVCVWANPYGSPMVVVYSRIRNANAACTGTVVYVVPSQYVRRNYFDLLNHESFVRLRCMCTLYAPSIYNQVITSDQAEARRPCTSPPPRHRRTDGAVPVPASSSALLGRTRALVLSRARGGRVSTRG